MKRGEIWWVDFDPAVGQEIQKSRPAVIVSNDDANQVLGRLQVVPLTTAVRNLYPSEAVVTFRGRPHKALADQLRTVDKSRLDNRVGQVSSAEMRDIEDAILLQLGLAE